MKTVLRAKFNSLQMWIADDVAWLLAHGVTTNAGVARDRENQAHAAHHRAVDAKELRGCRPECACDICFNCDVLRHRCGSAMRDANRFSDQPDPGFHLFGNERRSTPEELLELLQAFLKAVEGVAESR